MWGQLAESQDDLKGLSLRITLKRIPNRGQFHVLYAMGPELNLRVLCNRLKARGEGCFLRHPPPDGD